MNYSLVPLEGPTQVERSPPLSGSASLIIPVYRNEENIPDLIEALVELHRQRPGLEVVFVIDGSPDRSAELLETSLGSVPFRAQLVVLSRNFGAFAAIRHGLAAATGEVFAVMAADLQEPPELVLTFFDELLQDRCDLVVGVRACRADPAMTRFTSHAYWSLYRRFVIRDIPSGGVDVFGCNKSFRDALLTIDERESFLIGQLFWLGFRRKEIPYSRRPRLKGKSAWKFRKRLSYMLDSVFAFSDLPITVLLWSGALGVLASVGTSIVVLGAWLADLIEVRGYVPIVLGLMAMSSLLIFGQGIIGCYIWRISENTKRRPHTVVFSHRVYPGADKQISQA